uniref:Uncharacterized protein n=1 Tax=Lactuca sativa TaxID=4236 RepID=A0A9R1X2E4_LACSA|nr:hypothetical protein LSAT_V11C700359670 [Lactuca sativa]
MGVLCLVKGPRLLNQEICTSCEEIDSTSNVSLDILEENSWSRALTISKVLLDKPQVPGIAHLYLVGRSKHDALAAEWTQRFANVNEVV